MTSTSRSEVTFSSSGKLENQAASTALSAARDTPSSSRSHPLLDDNGKLSAAGAATSLKYARAQDLPSFPSTGLELSSAGAAATLADSNKKPFEHWKPGAIPAANKAATEAKDYQMNPLWQPEKSKAGNSAAGQAIKMKFPGAITERESPAESRQKALLAATVSMAGSRRRADSAPLGPQQDSGWALKAARGSQKGPSTGMQPFSSGDPGFEAARIQNMSKKNVPRQMYGSNPPVAIEVEEKNRQAVLKASAIAMAKKMYAIQQSHIEEAKAGRRSGGQEAATKVNNHERSDASMSLGDSTTGTPRFSGLEEAAKKLAMERLAKLHDEHAEYRQYYGPTTPARARMSVRGFRRRASSDGQQLEDSDEEASRKIKTQMSMFKSQLAAVDSKKRQNDRDIVMAAAYKNVTKTMATLDEKVFQETGKQSPHQKILWEKEARDRAQKDSDDRMQNHGKVHIGGGRYMDQSEIDAIARARLQPTLDEISEKAEAQRAKDEVIRAEEEKRKRVIETEKTRQAQAKAEERATNQKEKAAAKARKDEEKKAQKERLAAEKGEKVKTKEARASLFGNFLGTTAAGGTAVGSGVVTAPIAAEESTAPDEGEHVAVDADDADETRSNVSEAKDEAAYHHLSTTTPAAEELSKDEDGAEANRFVSSLPGEEGWKDDDPPSTGDEKAIGTNASPDEEEKATSTPVSPTKSGSKVKTWFKSRFRTGSKSQKDIEDTPAISGEDIPATTDAGEAIEEEKETDSMRDVAMAGKTAPSETDDMYGASERAVSPVKDHDDDAAAAKPVSGSPSISSASSLYSKEASKPNSKLNLTHAPEDPDQARSTTSSEPPRGRRGFKERVLEKITSQKESNPTGPTTGAESEDPEEARDTFSEEKLAPPKTSTVGAEESGQPLSAKGSREGSKFKEEL